MLTVPLFFGAISNDVCVAFCVSVSGAQQTLKTTFMLFEEHLPPIRLCRSSFEDVAVHFNGKLTNKQGKTRKKEESLGNHQIFRQIYNAKITAKTSWS